MCLLNLILISFVTLTQCIAISPRYLSAAIQLHPSFNETLLNKTLVPYLEECETSSGVKGGNSEIDKTKMLCGSYLEMVSILDANKIDALKTKNDFDTAMNTYNEKNAGKFCAKFPEHFPKDAALYPESNKLFKFVAVDKRCRVLCLDTDVITYNETVKPFCQLIAYGFLQSEKLPQLNTTTNRNLKEVNNSELPNLIPVIAQANHIPEPTNDVTDSSQKLVNSSLAMNPETNSDQLDMSSGNKVEEKNKSSSIGKIEAAPKKSETSLGKPTSAVEQNPVEPVTEGSSPIEQPVEETGPANVDEQLQSISDKSKTVTNDDDNTSFDGSNGPDDAQANHNAVKDKLPNDDDNIDNNIEDGDEAKPINDDDDDDDGDEISAQNNNNNNNNNSDKFVPEQSPSIEQSPSKEQLLNNPFYNDPDSNFFTYFMFILLGCVIAYVVYHNKTKILALMLEGRRSSTSGRSGLSRRKHTAAYRKLDSNLEEAITSSANNRSTQVIY